MAHLDFTVWQFVRLMVHLEESEPLASADGDTPGLLVAWKDIWQPLDAQLSELGESDFEAYADMMMDQDVIVEDVPIHHVEQVVDGLRAVAVILDSEIEHGKSQGSEPEQQISLEYERDAMIELADRFAALTRPL